jgi:molybdopterin molybdotransferase
MDFEAQRIAQLTSLNEAYARIDALVRPVSPAEAATSAALGRTLAADMVVSTGRPAAPLALRDGWAVSSDAVADAGTYAPAPFAAVPSRVDVGDTLPAPADAVAPLDAVVIREGGAEAIAAVSPGEGALPAQADAAAGAVLRHAGQRLRLVDVAILCALGINRVTIRVPRLRLARAATRGDVFDAACALIANAAERDGAAVVGDLPHGTENFEAALRHEAADAVIAVGGTGSGRRDASVRSLARIGRLEFHGIAVAPGETAAFGLIGARPVLLLPGRVDAALAVWLTIGRRLLARLAGHEEADEIRTVELARKISSPVGMAEVVPVRRRANAVEPLATGYLPLGALAQADGWILIPADSEGFPAGAQVALRSLP